MLVLLRELTAVLPSGVAAQLPALLPGVLAALQDRGSAAQANLKIEALSFVRLLLVSNPPEGFQPHAPKLAPAVFATAGERYYKVAAEALRVCEQLIVVFAPPAAAAGAGAGAAPGAVPASLKPLVSPLFDTINARLTAQDQDQEVKEAAITAAAALVATLADELPAAVPGVLRLLLERLRNGE